ncbi:MAG: HD domain-containing protein, partial [Rhodospirillaceae bacterium]|nr:HD domain-containing protein [Rhodospirillaceae bacterium]
MENIMNTTANGTVLAGAEKEQPHRGGMTRSSVTPNNRFLYQTISAFATLVQYRDAYTSGHQQNVSDLARSIATELGLSRNQIEGVRIAGTLHDIGKIAVPMAILAKAGQLSGEEFNLIKTHSQVGHDILKGVDFPWPVAEAILQHHERPDGSGYPRALEGEAVILEARILGAADTVDAMASHRPYRPAKGIKHALRELDVGAGLHYDHAVVKACRYLFMEKGYKLLNS